MRKISFVLAAIMAIALNSPRKLDTEAITLKVGFEF